MIKYYARWAIDDNGTTQDFKIIEATIKDSIRETTYSYVTVDFRNKDVSLLPLQYSSMQIISVNESNVESLVFAGHLDSIKYPDFSTSEQPLKLELSIMNFRGFLSKLAVTVRIDNQQLPTALDTILIDLPLMGYGGFNIADADVKNYRVSDIFINQSLEKVLNYMANKFNFIWLIDYFLQSGSLTKQIYIYDIDKYIGDSTLKTIDDTNCFIQEATPSFTTVDYANVLNIRNMILITNNLLLPDTTSLVSGTSYMFTYPFSISENTCFRLNKLDPEGELNETYAFVLNTNIDFYTITVNLDTETITYSAEIGFDGIDNDNATKKILLITDAMDTTKVIGFKWKGTTETVDSSAPLYANSYSSLVPYQTQYLDVVEMKKIASRVGTSGRVEKIVDANGKYFTPDEVEDFAVSLFGQNNLKTSEINITLKGTNEEVIDYDLSDVVYINLPDIQTVETFLITDITRVLGTEIQEITLSGRSKNINENSMDIYRSDLEQETTDSLARKLVVLYNQDEKTVLSKEIYVNGVRVDV